MKVYEVAFFDYDVGVLIQTFFLHKEKAEREVSERNNAPYPISGGIWLLEEHEVDEGN